MTDQTTNVDLVVYALYDLGGAGAYVHTEDIALRCWQLWPERFSWSKFPQYPDLEPVRKRLSDARLEKFGELVRGRPRRGWSLTAAGVDRAKAVAATIKGALSDSSLPASDHQEMQRFLNNLERHSAFLKYVRSESCDDIEWFKFE